MTIPELNRRNTIRGGAIAGVVLAIGVALTYSGAEPVKVTVPEIRTVHEYITEDAKTRLGDEYVVDMPVAGTLERIELEVGDVVEKGDVIARVERYGLEHRIKEIEALIAETEARVTGVDIAKPKAEDHQSAKIRVTEMRDALEIAKKTRAVTAFNQVEAKRDLDRAKALLEAGAASEDYYGDAELRYNGLSEDLKRARLQEDNARKALELAELADRRLTGSVDDNEYLRDAYRAQIEGLQAQLAVLNHDLSKTEIRAPVSGPVLEKYIEDRRVLAPGTPLLRIGDLASLEIECDVLSEEVSLVRVGNAVEITGKALQGKTVMGRVARIYPAGFMKISSLGIEQQRVRTLIEYDVHEVALRPGTSVDVRIITAEAVDALAIPARSAFRKEGQWNVYAVVKGRVRMTPVEIGLRNDEWVAITSGLGADDTILRDPGNGYTDNDRVKPL